MHADADEEGQRRSPHLLPCLPPSLPAVMRLTVQLLSGITVRPDAGVLIVVDRSSKQCLRAAESGGVSLRVKCRGFTHATLVDNPLSGLKAPAV